MALKDAPEHKSVRSPAETKQAPKGDDKQAPVPAPKEGEQK